MEYIPGETNVVADSLSRIYSANSTGTVHAASEFISDNIAGDLLADLSSILSSVSCPVLTNVSVALASAALPTAAPKWDLLAMAPLSSPTTLQAHVVPPPHDG